MHVVYHGFDSYQVAWIGTIKIVIAELKECTGCGLEKSLDEFYTRKTGVQTGQPLARCKDCVKARAKQEQRERRANGQIPPYDPERQRNCWLQWKYGITAVEYDQMELAQNGVCAICSRLPKRNRLHVDHCHKTGRIRGLLCNNCNRMLGLGKDDADILRAGADYLMQELC